MWDYNVAMATFCTFQCQDGGKVFKQCYEWRHQGIKDASENLNTQKSTARRILSGILKILNLSQNSSS